jgi:hypothetical protein
VQDYDLAGQANDFANQSKGWRRESRNPAKKQEGDDENVHDAQSAFARAM